MSTSLLVSAPVLAELPDWILALRPSEADLSTTELAESAVFIGLAVELE